MATFAQTVQQGRRAAHLSQARMAQLLGIPPGVVRSWESGRSVPGQASMVVAVAAVLGLDEAELLERAGLPPPVMEDRLTLEEALASITPEGIEVTMLAPEKLDGASPESPIKVTLLEPPPPPQIVVVHPDLQPSYMEIGSVRAEYRRRAIYTTVGIVLILIVLLYLVGRSSSNISDWWDGLMGMLDF